MTLITTHVMYVFGENTVDNNINVVVVTQV